MALYGTPPKHTCRVVAVDVDGEVAGIGALVKFGEGSVCIVSAMTNTLKGKKFPLHRAALQIMRWVKEEGLPEVFALQDPESDTSPIWLKRLGFEIFGTKEDWRVWRWQKPQ